MICKDFSIPFNGDFALLKYALSSGNVYEVYFSLYGGKQRNANNYGASEKPILNNSKQIKLLSSMASLYKTGLNLLINSPSLFFSDFEELKEKVMSIKGINTITLSDPIAVKTFVKEFPNIDIQASFIMNLNSIEKIEQFSAMGGGTVVLPGIFLRDINKLEELKKLKERYPKLKVKMIANLDCAQDCIYLPSHYLVGMFRGFDIQPGNIYNDQPCYRPVSPAEFIKIPFIRPEDLDFYRKNGFADSFKLIYRSSPTAMLEKVYNAYFSGEYGGNLFDIIPTHCDDYECARDIDMKVNLKMDIPEYFCDNRKFPADFIEKVTSCGRKCHQCNYCMEIAKKTNTVTSNIKC